MKWKKINHVVINLALYCLPMGFALTGIGGLSLSAWIPLAMSALFLAAVVVTFIHEPDDQEILGALAVMITQLGTLAAGMWLGVMWR